MTIAVVQSGTGGHPAVTPATVILPASPTAGNVLVFAVSYYYTATLTAPAGVTPVGTVGMFNHVMLAFYSRIAAPGDETAWTFTQSADFMSAVAVELSGVDTAVPFDNTPTYSSASLATAITSPTVIPSVTGCYGLAAVAMDNDFNLVPSVGAPWGVLVDGRGDYHSVSMAGQANLTTASVTGATFTTDSSDLEASTLVVRPAIPAISIVPPTGLTATVISQNEIDLSWGGVTNARAYDLQRNGVVIATGLTGTSYQDTGLVAGTTYTYNVRSVF